MLGLAHLLQREALAASTANPLAPKPGHFPAKAKRVIWLTMAGGPSHLETFDHKPKLAEMHGKPMPESFTKGQPIAQLQNQQLNCFGPQHSFTRYGKAGAQISTLFPHIGLPTALWCVRTTGMSARRPISIASPTLSMRPSPSSRRCDV